MDDTEDDARYPPNPRPPKPRHYVSSSSSSRPKAPFCNPPPPQLGRLYADDEEDEDEEEQNDMDEPLDDDDDDEGGGYHRTQDCGGEDDDSSSESRGKRRRIDKFALGFEFAPRVPPAAVASSKPAVRSLPPEWSEDSTFVLLDAWGDRYLQNGRKSLRSDEWSEVAKKVSQASKVNRSDAQCRNRLDTLKKKYKKEKATMAEHENAGSKWVYFKKMDILMSMPSPTPPVARQLQQPPPPPRLPCGVDAGEYVFASSSVYQNRCNGNDEMRDSPGDSGTEDDGVKDGDDPDRLPPKRENVSRSSDSSFKTLAESIQKFGEIYEKMENRKRQQMAELERMRKQFQRDLEAQKRQILERAQVEVAKLSKEQSEEDDEEDTKDREEDDDDGDDGGSAENLSG